MEYLRIEEETPPLRDPALVVAFAGWNDAAEAATTALSFLVTELSAKRFASIDPEEFYSFGDTRPVVRLTEGVVREIIWPGNHFFCRQGEDQPRDLLLLSGIEPQLKWRAFSQVVVETARRAGVGTAILLGAFLADVAHSRPARVTASTSDPEMAARVGGTIPRYEGPTGIVGVLADAFHKAGMVTVSFWASVPHYLPAVSNPKAAMALLRRVGELLELQLDLTQLEKQAVRFEAQVNAAVAGNPEMAAYIKQLEMRDSAREPQPSGAAASPEGNGANAEGLIKELEEFLRRQREQEER